MVQQQEGIKMVTLRQKQYYLSTSSTNFYSRSHALQEHSLRVHILLPRLQLLPRLHLLLPQPRTNTFISYRSFAATRAKPPTHRAAAPPARLHLTFHEVAQTSPCTLRTMLKHQLTRHLHHEACCVGPCGVRQARWKRVVVMEVLTYQPMRGKITKNYPQV